jgi:hypothetical protein
MPRRYDTTSFDVQFSGLATPSSPSDRYSGGGGGEDEEFEAAGAGSAEPACGSGSDGFASGGAAAAAVEGAPPGAASAPPAAPPASADKEESPLLLLLVVALIDGRVETKGCRRKSWYDGRRGDDSENSWYPRLRLALLYRADDASRKQPRPDLVTSECPRSAAMRGGARASRRINGGEE